MALTPLRAFYEALRRHHYFQVAVLAGDLVEATLEFEGHIDTSEEDDSLSRDRPMSPSGRNRCSASRRPDTSLVSGGQQPTARLPEAR